ncbi:MAG: type II toxin-antitoxin system PemK/MazF family toxin [Pseudonocardia sp.]|nr:type II toxin-antitoxin system PemK/MazF family toxin [Pseudonocardia sp.]
MRRGEIWRYEPVVHRAGQSTDRLIVSADSLNAAALPTVYAMQMVDTDPGSLLAVRVGEHGWALATAIERPLRERLVERIGQAGPKEMEQVDNAIRATFDL